MVGTRKGAFILTSDGKREKWKVNGPHFAGWEIYHLKGSPVDPNRLYVSQSSNWFGQIIQRSRDGGKTWEVPGGDKIPGPSDPPGSASNKFAYDTSPETGKLSPRTSGTTAHLVLGSSSASGIWNRRPATPIRFTPASKMPRSFAAPMAESRGASFLACAVTAPDPTGSPALAVCACIRF